MPAENAERFCEELRRSRRRTCSMAIVRSAAHTDLELGATGMRLTDTQSHVATAPSGRQSRPTSLLHPQPCPALANALPQEPQGIRRTYHFFVITCAMAAQE